MTIRCKKGLIYGAHRSGRAVIQTRGGSGQVGHSPKTDPSLAPWPPGAVVGRVAWQVSAVAAESVQMCRFHGATRSAWLIIYQL